MCVCGCDERETKCTGTTDANPPHCKDLGDLKPVFKVRVDVRVHTKARPAAYANERKDEMKDANR